MQDITFNEKYLITLKVEYDKAMKSNLEDKVFRLEEKLYDFIVKNYSEVLNHKLKLIDEFRNKDFKLWTIAFISKQLKSSEITKYKPDQQIYLKNFNREYLLGYYSLCFFAQNNFDRNTILNNKEPDKFAFTHFRSKYPDIDYPFNLIIEDLISYKTKSIESKQIEQIDNELLIKHGISSEEIKLTQYLYRRIPLKQIAKELNKAENTLKAQRNSIYGKLQIRSQEEMIQKISLTN